ncbi:MAG: signal peptide peptidase SppA [Anaerovoracaceae bacterium]
MDEEKKDVFSSENGDGVRFYNLSGEETPQQGSMKNGNTPKKSSLKKNLLIFAAILAVIAVLGCIAVACSGPGDDKEKYPDEEYIARLDVEGTIADSGNEDYFGNPEGYQHQWTLDTIDELMDDPNNKGIIFFLDTPGGGVYESDELYLKIKEYQETTGRPVYSYMGSMAASGGYYISAPCDKIIANRNCWTGSIGVTMGSYLDFSQLLENYGVKVNTITSGANKAMGSSLEKMTDEQRAIFQSLVDEAYEQFTGIVADGRNLDIETVKKLADGRIYTAKQALEAGLIDEIATYEEACDDMKKQYNLEDCTITELEPDNSDNIFGSLFAGIDLSKLQMKSDVSAIVELAEQENRFPVSYMCEALQ